MLNLKGKLTGKLSNAFADPSRSSRSSGSGSPPRDRSQARHSKEGQSWYSFLSPTIPSAILTVYRSNKEQNNVNPTQSLRTRGSTETLDSFEDCNEEFMRKDTPRSYEKHKELCLKSMNKEEYNNHENDDERPYSEKSTSDSDIFEEASEPSPEKTLPKLSDDSAFISPELYEFLESSLPNLARGCHWMLLYSTLKHGISMRTLIRKSSDLPGPSLLIVGDKQGAVFGGLLECPLRPTAKRKYQGTYQTFVFTTIYGAPRLFRPTGANRYFCLCVNDLLALGGGGNFALCLDGDLLNGSSGPCDTFGNSCLAHTPDFEVKNVELWGFTHVSKYRT